MIQAETVLNVADNSGAKKIKCIRVLGGTNRRYAHVGDIVIASVKVAIPNSNVKRKNVVRAVIVRTKSPIKRKDGSILKFNVNSAIIIDNNNNPKGTRIFGPIARELRDRNFSKIISLSPEVL